MSEMDQFILEWIADYCTGRINAEEAGKLREWIDKASENRELFEQYLKTVKINRMVEGADWLDEERAWQELAGKIRQEFLPPFVSRGCGCHYFYWFGDGFLAEKQTDGTGGTINTDFTGIDKSHSDIS